MKKVAWSPREIMSSVWYYENIPAQLNEANPAIWSRVLELVESLEEATFIRFFKSE